MTFYRAQMWPMNPTIPLLNTDICQGPHPEKWNGTRLTNTKLLFDTLGTVVHWCTVSSFWLFYWYYHGLYISELAGLLLPLFRYTYLIYFSSSHHSYCIPVLIFIQTNMLSPFSLEYLPTRIFSLHISFLLVRTWDRFHFVTSKCFNGITSLWFWASKFIIFDITVPFSVTQGNQCQTQVLSIKSRQEFSDKMETVIW